MPELFIFRKKSLRTDPLWLLYLALHALEDIVSTNSDTNRVVKMEKTADGLIHHF